MKTIAVPLLDDLKKHFRSSLYSNAYYLMINQAVAALGGFIFWIIAARFFTTEAVGLAGAIISAISLIASISDLGLSYGLIHFLPHAGSKTSKMLNTSFTVYWLVAMLASAIFLLGLGLWSPALLFLRSSSIYFIIFIVFTVISGSNALLQNVFIAHRSSKITSFMSVIFRLASLPLLAAFVFLLNDFSGILAAQYSALLICLLIATFLFLPRINKGYLPHPEINKMIIKEILPYSIGNHVGLFIGAATTWLLPVIVLNILGAEASAHFYIAWSIAVAATVISSGLATSTFAESSHDEDSLLRNIGRSLKLSLLLGIVAIAIIFGLGDKLLLLFGKGYSEEGTTVLRLLSLVVLPLSITSLYMVYGRVKSNFKIIIGINVAATTSILTLTFLLAPKLGITGVAAGYLIAHTMIALGIIIIVLRKEPGKKLALIWRGNK